MEERDGVEVEDEEGREEDAVECEHGEAGEVGGTEVVHEAGDDAHLDEVAPAVYGLCHRPGDVGPVEGQRGSG